MTAERCEVPIVDVRSSWVMENGWARRLGAPKPVVAPYEHARPHIKVGDRIRGRISGLEMAKYEIARRIRDRKATR